jgi:nucleoside-diphosphate-sugar epimerase
VVLLAGVVRAPSRDEILDANLAIVATLLRAYGNAATRPPLFFPSSLHVYARSPDPVAPGAPTLPPRSWYGAVKLACEAVLSEGAARLGIPLWIGRMANVVSTEPPVNRMSFVHDMRTSLADEGRIVVRGSPVRDVISPADLARGLLARRDGLRPGATLLENACSGRPLHLEDLGREAVDLARTAGRSAELALEPATSPDVMLGVPASDRVFGDGVPAAELAAVIAGPAAPGGGRTVPRGGPPGGPGASTEAP